MAENEYRAQIELPGASREMVAKWVKEGYSRDTVSVWGTSIENFSRSLRAGHIRSYTVDDDYRGNVGIGHGHLYYSLPIGERVCKIDESLYEDFLSNYSWNTAQLLEEMSKSNSLDVASFYARRQASEHFFLNTTGQQADHSTLILLAARQLGEANPDLQSFLEISHFSLEGVEDHVYRNYEEEYRLLEERMHDLENANLLLAETMKRKGVLVYFNQKLLEYRSHAGVESEDELMTLSDEPLGFDVIGGIKLMGQAEKEILGV